MKKLMTIVMLMSLMVSLSSCRCLLVYLAFGGSVLGIDQCLIDAAFHSNLGDAMYGENPAVTLNETNAGQTGTSSSEQGGDNQQEEDTGSSFRDILSSPRFTLGPSLSWLGGDKEDSEKFPAKPGFQLGATWQVPVGNRINVEPGLLYSNRGLGYESEESGTYEPGVPSYNYSYGQKKRLHYLELPIFVSTRIAEGFEVYGGPQVGFLLGAKVVNESNGETTSTEKGTDGFKKVDVGLAAGVRYNIPNTQFGVSLGYYHGFTNLSSNEYSGYGYDGPKYYTNAARVGVCYTYHGSPKKKTAGTGRKVD